MSRSDWLSKPALVGITLGLVLFLLGALVALTSYQKHHAHQRETAAAEQKNQINEQRRSCVFAPDTRVLTCAPHPDHGVSSEKYTQYDLQAQQDMAEWAFAMFMVSLLGVFITGAATYYVAMTLDETRIMVGESEKTTAAAVRSAVAAEDALISSERPWIKVEAKAASGLTFPLDGEGRVQGSIDIDFTVTNFGKSPALNVLVYAHLWPDIWGSKESVRTFFAETLDARDEGVRLGRTVFPNSPQTEKHSLIIAPSDIERTRQFYHDLVFEDLVSADILCCVAYVNSRTGKNHETGVVFHLLRKHEKGSMFHIREGAPLHEIVVIDSIIGSYVT